MDFWKETELGTGLTLRITVVVSLSCSAGLLFEHLVCLGVWVKDSKIQVTMVTESTVAESHCLIIISIF